MKNVKGILDAYRVRTFTLAGTITDVRELLDNSAGVCLMANKLINDLLEKDIHFNEEVYTRIYIKKVAYDLFLNGFNVEEDVDSFLDEVQKYATAFVNDPKWSFLTAIESEEDTIKSVPVAFVEGIDLKVAVKIDSSGVVKIKKGGKQLLAAELFKKHILEPIDEKMSNKDFLALIMKELQMSKPGANTYFFNLRKEYGMVTARK